MSKLHVRDDSLGGRVSRNARSFHRDLSHCINDNDVYLGKEEGEELQERVWRQV